MSEPNNETPQILSSTLTPENFDIKDKAERPFAFKVIEADGINFVLANKKNIKGTPPQDVVGFALNSDGILLIDADGSSSIDGSVNTKSVEVAKILVEDLSESFKKANNISEFVKGLEVDIKQIERDKLKKNEEAIIGGAVIQMVILDRKNLTMYVVNSSAQSDSGEIILANLSTKSVHTFWSRSNRGFVRHDEVKMPAHHITNQPFTLSRGNKYMAFVSSDGFRQFSMNLDELKSTFINHTYSDDQSFAAVYFEA